MIRWASPTALCTPALLLLAGCAAVQDPGPVVEEPTAAERTLSEAIEAARQAEAEPPEAVRDALIPPLLAPLAEPPEQEPRFDVSVVRAAAGEFFLGLVEGTPYNVVVHPEVSGEISLQLKSVTVPEVMEIVQHMYGYAYRQVGGAFFVMPPQLQTRLYEVNYLNLRRAGQSQTRVSSGQVSEQETRERDTGRSREPVEERGAQRSVSGSLISTSSEADLWQEFTRALQEIIGSGAGRKVVTSPNSGVAIVRAMPDELRDVELYLHSVQESLQRQVILEAKVVEVTLDDGFRSGINWALLNEQGKDVFLGGQIGGGASLEGTGLSDIDGNSGVLDPRVLSLPLGTETSAFGGVFTLAIETDDFSAFVELLETQGETQVLSSPRVATLNNQKAVIKVGTDEFFVTDISTTTVTGAATTTSPSVTLTPFFSGIALDVTPQIDAQGDVTLHIHPSVSEVVDQVKTIAVGTEVLNLPLALSTIRETDSIVRARTGQVIVIGGLMQDNMSDERASTPFLSKIPLLGSLFEHNGERALKRELVILLRPIVVGPATWRETLESSAARLRAMRERQQRGGRP